MERRTFLVQSLAAMAATQASAQTPSSKSIKWEQGPLVHLLPTASDRRILIKASFRDPLKSPQLHVGHQRVAGKQTDGAGLFWSFDASGLEPGTQHLLQISEGRKELCAPWHLSTLPDPNDRSSRFRLLIYTCAGGNFMSVEIRQRILKRAMSFKPDAVIANGDHVYWDQRGGAPGRRTPERLAAGVFDRAMPIIGMANETVLHKAVGPQIAALYGTMFREVPVWFISDDHDYFENDDADDVMVTFPPDAFMERAARATRRMYYPEFLPDANRPLGLAGASAPDTPVGSAESFGTIRYGKLAEVLLYDCRRYLTLAGPTGVVVPSETENWLTGRMGAGDTDHVVNVPSLPIGWTAGKWGDWYPDFLDSDGKLGTKRPKPFWQTGWMAQHDRLLKAASAMKERVPMFLQGDLHAIGDARIHKTGSVDLSANPVVAMLMGPVGTSGGVWPSAARHTGALPPQHLEEEEKLAALEENGFSIVDFTPDRADFRFFKWRKEKAPEEAIDHMEPFYQTSLKRPG